MQLIKSENRLPKLPVVIGSLDGENLNLSSLRLHPGIASSEQAIFDFRQTHAPEKLPHFRRYYLQPQIRGGRPTGNHVLRYVWNTKRPKTDVTVGVVHGENLAEARVLIGNQIAGAYMSPIRWDLCEDRDGSEPIDIGRFDVWSLLKDVTEADLENLSRAGVTPDVGRWDFDKIFMDQTCPGCNMKVSVNMYAYNIDSAKCVQCGIRPFLSRALVPHLKYYLPGATRLTLDADDGLMHYVEWLGGVDASVSDLHPEDLPEGTTPHQVMLAMLDQSKLLQAHTDGSVSEPDITIAAAKQLSADERKLLGSATRILREKIESGGPFSALHGHMAAMLREVSR